jgi:hypothetical protein
MPTRGSLNDDPSPKICKNSAIYTIIPLMESSQQLTYKRRAWPTAYSAHPDDFKIAFLSVLLCSLFHIISINYFPTWFVDESLTVSRVAAVIATGDPHGALDQTWSHKGARPTYIPSLPYQIFSIPHRLGAELAIESARWICAMALVVLLSSVAVLAWRYIAPSTSAWAVLVASFSATFLNSGHVARPDILAAACAYAALALYQPKRLTLFISFFLSSISLILHARSIVLFIPLLGLVSLDFYRRRFSWHTLATSILGLFLGLGIWGIDALFQGSLHAFFGSYQQGASLTLMGTSSGLTALQQTLNDALQGLEIAYPQAWPLVLFAILSLIMGKGRLAWLLLAPLVLSVPTFSGFVPVKMIMISPIFDLALVYFVFRLSQVAWSSARLGAIVRFGLPLVIACSICQTVVGVLLYPSPCAAEKDRVAADLNRLIPPGSNVMGEETFWNLLRETHYTPWKDLKFFRDTQHSTLLDQFKVFKPDYYLMDWGQDIFLSDSPFAERFRDSLRLPRTELKGILHDYGTNVGSSISQCFGVVKVYEMEWTNAHSAINREG